MPSSRLCIHTISFFSKIHFKKKFITIFKDIPGLSKMAQLVKAPADPQTQRAGEHLQSVLWPPQVLRERHTLTHAHKNRCKAFSHYLLTDDYLRTHTLPFWNTKSFTLGQFHLEKPENIQAWKSILKVVAESHLLLSPRLQVLRSGSFRFSKGNQDNSCPPI